MSIDQSVNFVHVETVFVSVPSCKLESVRCLRVSISSNNSIGSSSSTILAFTILMRLIVSFERRLATIFLV